MMAKSIAEINRELASLKKRDVKEKKKMSLKKKIAYGLAEIGGGTWAAGRAVGMAPEIAAPIFTALVIVPEAYEHREWLKKKLHKVI